MVMLSHDGLDRFSRLFGIVPWDGGEMVMNHMCMCNVMKEVRSNKANVAVNC